MLYVVETKSTSEDFSEGSVYRKRLVLDVQISVYKRAALQMGLDARGIGYDVLGRPACKPYQATPAEARKYTVPTKKEPVSRLYANQRERDETVEEFEARCLQTISASPNDYYARFVVVRLEQESLEAAADLWATTQAMRDAKRLKMFPRNPDSCISWSRTCELFPICSGTSTPDDGMLYRRESAQHEELDLLEDDKVRVTQSSIRAFRSCQRKYELRYQRGVRSLVTPEPLLSGTSIHSGVEILRKGGTLEQAFAKMNDPRRSFSSAKERAMLRGWLARWGAPRGIVAAERQFEIPLINPATGAASKTFKLAGKMDAIFEGQEWEFLDPRRAA